MMNTICTIDTTVTEGGYRLYYVTYYDELLAKRITRGGLSTPKDVYDALTAIIMEQVAYENNILQCEVSRDAMFSLLLEGAK